MVLAVLVRPIECRLRTWLQSPGLVQNQKVNKRSRFCRPFRQHHEREKNVRKKKQQTIKIYAHVSHLFVNKRAHDANAKNEARLHNIKVMRQTYSAQLSKYARIKRNEAIDTTNAHF